MQDGVDTASNRGEAGAARADSAVGVMKKEQTLTPIGCGALLMGDNI